MLNPELNAEWQPLKKIQHSALSIQHFT